MNLILSSNRSRRDEKTVKWHGESGGKDWGNKGEKEGIRERNREKKCHQTYASESVKLPDANSFIHS